jgi:multicomponent Na+:H+ antiporter subunit F
MIQLVPLENDPTHWLFLVAGAVFGIALLASVWRLVVGPSLPDRVVAVDLIGFLAVGIICVFSIVTQRSELIGVAVVAALILFLGTAAFAIYLDRRARP